MPKTASDRTGVDELIARLDRAVELSDVAQVTARVKAELETLLGAGALRLPARFLEPRPDGYARRLLHRDPARRYTAVVMTWGPGQGTALHDHAGIWCVEGVVEGRMSVTQFDLVETRGDGFRFEEKGSVRATVGTAGCLIPPFEYHVLANAHIDRPSITLHVYGGEMDHCHVFEPRADGFHERRSRTLGYHD